MKKYFPSSELIINEDGSVFHLHVKPEWLADKVILVGDPGRVALVASHFENKECEVESREFKTITGTYKGKRITVVSTGIGCDNIDIVMNELDALANIDFNTREEKDSFRQLELVRISKLVLRKGLDAGTAFEILSIDIADIDIGKNIGAALQIDQANADKNIAQAKAEERRAMAVASEQEMKAKAQEARAKVIEAEAEVPKAMAEAFRSGNLGIMDYYRMKNIEADTSMRENIAKPTTGNAGNQPLSK